MDTFSKIETQLSVAKEKRKKLITDAMDGRSQRHISLKTGIDETKLSRWVNGEATLEADELIKISNVLGTDFN